MNDSGETRWRGWAAGPTAKEKSAVQRSVTALLDALAPERVIKRDSVVSGPVERYRTPGGCVLQAGDAALSLSWFAARTSESIGELHINVWRGTVSRGGSSYRRTAHASIVSERVLYPVTSPDERCLWRTDDGIEFDTAALAAHCGALLDEQIKTGGQRPPG
jgi:hypothetical protein